MKVLKELCEIIGPSGQETAVRDYIIKYVREHNKTWKVRPEIFYGDVIQDCLILKFGNPRTAVFAHMDSHGYTVRYEDQLVPIGSPEAPEGTILVGTDNLGTIECKLKIDPENYLQYGFGRPIQTGTNLVYKIDFRETGNTVQSGYLDNRMGIYSMVKLAETLENGLLVFSCWEEHGGGSVPFLIRFIYEQWRISQVLIADITWVTGGVRPGEGVVISMRDMNIPRRSYIEKIISIADKHQFPYQLEVEGSGSSDGREIQLSPYPIDWCFIGAPEDNVHSPDEIINKSDINSMIALYKALMKEL